MNRIGRDMWIKMAVLAIGGAVVALVMWLGGWR